MTNDAIRFQARKTNSILRLDSAGRQTEVQFFNDILQRNSATIQYLTSWGLDIVSNHVPRPLFTNGSTRLNRVENSTSEDDEEYEQRNIHEYDYSYGHFANAVRIESCVKMEVTASRI